MAWQGDDAFAHCRQLIAQADKDRYWASLFAPADRRDELYALYAFDLELAAVHERVREPMAGEIRLQWWREVLEGKRGEEAAAHPIAAALLASLLRHGIDVRPLHGLINARGAELYDEPIARVTDLENRGEATSGAIFAAAAQMLGGQGSEIAELCGQAGLAQTYLNAMRTVRSTHPRLAVPTEILDYYEAKRPELGVGRAELELRAALAEMRLRARRHLGIAAAILPRAQPQILPAFLPAALIPPSLARMETRSYDPFHPCELPAWRRQWLIWRAARDPRRIFR